MPFYQFLPSHKNFFIVIYINFHQQSWIRCNTTPQVTTLFLMSQCEGRPDGPCPDNKNDWSVRLTQGDLLQCELNRFPYLGDQATKCRKKKGNVASVQVGVLLAADSSNQASTTTTMVADGTTVHTAHSDDTPAKTVTNVLLAYT